MAAVGDNKGKIDYEYEYGRYKKKVEDQQKEIRKLREDAEGWVQLLDANNALIAAIVDSVGGELIVGQDGINRAVKGGLKALVRYDELKKEYTLTCNYEVGE